MDQHSAHPQHSYTRGSQDKALLAMTIGQAFDNTVARYPQGEALVVRHQQLRQLDATGRGGGVARQGAAGAGPCRPGSPSASGAQLCPVVHQPVRQREDRGDSGQHQPGLSQLGAGVRAQAVRLWLVCAGSFKTSDYHAMLQGPGAGVGATPGRPIAVSACRNCAASSASTRSRPQASCPGRN